jgi:putative DNA primase/helicase
MNKTKGKDNPPPNGWGALYQNIGLACCTVERGTKRPKGMGWQEAGRQSLEAAQLDAVLRDGGGLGCVHGHSGTAVLDLDTDLHLVLWALSAAGIDALNLLTIPTAATIGDRAKPPKLWWTVPAGAELGAHKLTWTDVPAGVKGVRARDGETHGTLTVLELRTGDVQDVLPPSMHPSGVPYIWATAAPAARGDLYEIPPSLLELWQRWERVGERMQRANPWNPDTNKHTKRGREFLLNAVRVNLRKLEEHPIWQDAVARAWGGLEQLEQFAPTTAQPKPTKQAPAKRQNQHPPAAVGEWAAEDWCVAWCEHVEPQSVLERNGYAKARTKSNDAREVARYLAPGSTTGEAGVVVLRGDDGRVRAYSHHGTDVLARAGGSLDSWGLLKLLEHAGDTGHAIKAARVELESMGVEVPAARTRKDRSTVRQQDQTHTPAGEARGLASQSAQPSKDRQQTVSNGSAAPPPRPAQEGVAGLVVSLDVGARDHTEDGLALSLGDMWDGTVRHTPLMGVWHRWNGQRWEQDVTGYHKRSALDHLRDAARHELLVAHTVEDRGAVKAAERRAAVMRQARTVSAVVSLAGIHARQATAHTEWDQHPYLLATPGGTVNLQTGETYTPRPADMLTQSTAVAPAPAGAVPELWLATLHYLMGGDIDPDRSEELVAYLKRLCGYMLTGSVQEHVLAFGYGTGRNGKTLIVQTLLDLMGDYAISIPPGVLMDSKQQEHPEHLARLMGRRLAVGSETEQGRRWAEAKIKALTGGDRITARYMHQNSFDFTPQFKLLLVGNHKPNLRQVDVAMRRRLHLIPFEVTVPEHKVDPKLPRKLKREGPAILRWMIEGCREWQDLGGLKPPQAVLDATADYFEEQDIVGLWMDECCKLDPTARTSSATVWESWQRWSMAAGYMPGSPRTLMPNLRRRGIIPGLKSTGGFGWLQGWCW